MARVKVLYTQGKMMKNDEVMMIRVQERIEQVNATEVVALTAERATLVEDKRAATAAGDSAGYVRCLARIAAIDTRLQEMGA